MNKQKKANKFLATRKLEEDEYFNEADGLIYCRACHTPRQTHVKVPGGGSITPNVLCKCRQEAWNKEENERKLRERKRTIARLKSTGLQDKAQWDFTFANDSGLNPKMQDAQTYVGNWPMMEEDGRGLLLWGNVGTGKTYMAACIANALIEQFLARVLMRNPSMLLDELYGLYPGERNHYIESLHHYRLLIIDDFGIERNSSFALEQMFNLVDSWYRSQKPLIVTTNMTLEEMKNPEDLMHARIYERILERCLPVMVNDHNIRKEFAASNMRQAKSLFTTS